MQKTARKCCVGDLLDKRIVTAEGKYVGHVADIQLSDDQQFRVVALIYGRAGWLYRLHVLDVFAQQGKQAEKPPRIPWEAVDRVEDRHVLLKSGYEVKKQQVIRKTRET